MSSQQPPKLPSGSVSSRSAAERVHALIARVGERQACQLLATNPTTLSRVAAGLPIRAGTLRVIEDGLQVAEAPTPPEAA